MADDLVLRAHRGDLSAMNLAGIVRLSYEAARTDRHAADGKPRYLTGKDIVGRDEQAGDCRQYAERRGGAYVFTYEEPDTSAWKRRRVTLPDGRTAYRVVRPVYEAALDDLKRGIAPNGERLDGLVVYDIDRLTRDNRDLEDAIEVVQHYGRPILDWTDTLDLLTDNGRTVARIIVATANKQSADAARRVTRKHRALQAAGIPTGGRRPFGWQDDKRTLHVVEAPALKDGIDRLLKGAALAAVVAGWNDAGILTPAGNRWTSATARTMLRSPRLCGRRAKTVRQRNDDGTETVYLESVLDGDGTPVTGLWEPMISVPEWQSLVAIVGSRPFSDRGKNARTYLLTGLLRCGKCGRGRMRAVKVSPKKRSANGVAFTYGCESKANGGCGGGTTIAGPQADKAISELVIAKYEIEAERRAASEDRGEWPKSADLDLIQRDITELTAAWRERKISGSRYFGLLPAMEEEERALSRQRDEWRAAAQLVASRPASIRAEWPDLPLAQQRAYLRDVLAAVIVHPIGDRRRRFTPDRLEPVWAD